MYKTERLAVSYRIDRCAAELPNDVAMRIMKEGMVRQLSEGLMKHVEWDQSRDFQGNLIFTAHIDFLKFK